MEQLTSEAPQGEYEELKAAFARVSSELQSAKAEQERLKLIIKKLQHRLFGKSSERRRETSTGQGWLFDLSPVEQAEPKAVSIQAHTRRCRPELVADEEAPEGTFPAHLPRKEEFIDEKPEGVADEDLELMSSKVTERLDSAPEQHQVIRIVRRVYKQKSTGKIFTPAAPEHVLDRRCKVTAGFIVLMAVKKFLWHLPIYRQQQQLKLQGINLSRESMVVWTLEFGALLGPIAQALAEAIREEPIVHCDDTPITVGKGNKRGEKKYEDGYLWPILAKDIGVAFIYRPSRAWREVYTVLKEFGGTLVSDAHEAYENFVAERNIGWQLCWMHIRRNFFEAQSSNPELAKKALEYIGQLYQVERDARGDPAEKRLLKRLNQSKPILDEFHAWLKQQSASPAVLTDPLMSKACSYVLKRWEAACLFVYDGELPLDNGADERALRPVKLGAKNWLHCASEGGAEVAAVFYTLIASALMHGIHPYYYLLDLTTHLVEPATRISARSVRGHRG